MAVSILYADPPWQFKTYSAKGQDRSPEQHYSTMSIADIYSLGDYIKPICADNSVLFLWGTWPLLAQALATGTVWGFTYKTVAFVWAKSRQKQPSGTTLDAEVNWFMGTGYWTRANTEFCLLFTRGKVSRQRFDVRQLVVAPFTRHSEKPTAVYERIEALMGDVTGDKLELFARQPREGWLSYGNEITGNDIREDLKKYGN